MSKKQGLDSNKTGNFARASRFLYISLPSFHDFNVKLANFTLYGKRWHNRTVFRRSFSDRDRDRAPYNSIPEKFANIWQIKRGRIR